MLPADGRRTAGKRGSVLRRRPGTDCSADQGRVFQGHVPTSSASQLPRSSAAFSALLWLCLLALAGSAAAQEPPASTQAPAAPSATPPQSPAPPPPVKDKQDEEAANAPHPPPLNVEYAQYGVAIAGEINLNSGAACPEDEENPNNTPCIIGSGGGLTVRAGYRSPGPWYIGGAYEFIKMDSGNLYRLGIFQQLRLEMRYLPDIGAYRVSPYVTWGLGGVGYGNEWGMETGGALLFVGGGVEFEVSRVALLGLNLVYRPVLIAGWTDTAGQERDTALAQFIGFDLVLEIRTELERR